MIKEICDVCGKNYPNHKFKVKKELLNYSDKFLFGLDGKESIFVILAIAI